MTLSVFHLEVDRSMMDHEIPHKTVPLYHQSSLQLKARASNRVGVGPVGSEGEVKGENFNGSWMINVPGVSEDTGPMIQGTHVFFFFA